MAGWVNLMLLRPVIFDPTSAAFHLSKYRSIGRRASWEHFVSALV